MHALYATLLDGRIVKGQEFEAYGEAIEAWGPVINAQGKGLFPHVRHFEVRDASDPKYLDAPLSTAAFLRVITPRGFGNSTGARSIDRTGAEKAASKAWPLFAPNPRGRNAQGVGGWFFTPDGRTVAQGLRDLARVCERRGLIVQGHDLRWYVTELADPTHFEQTKAAA